MLDGHNAQVAALIADCADLPPHLLERAVSELSRTSRFMPRAADLIAKVQSYVTPKREAEDDIWARRVREGNRMLIEGHMQGRAHWETSGSSCSLVSASMSPAAYSEAMTVDPAILPLRR